MTATGWSPTDSDYQARLLRAHEDLRAHAELRATDAPVRDAVLESWRRSLTARPTADASDGTGHAVLEGDDLSGARETHLFSAVLPLLEATSRAVQEELRALLPVGRPPQEVHRGVSRRILPRSPEARRPEILLTGRRTPLLRSAAGSSELSGRHAELLTLLHLHPDGISGAELAEDLHGTPAAEGTVRAEVVRLRRRLAEIGGPEILARPYRLQGPLESDLSRARAALERGDVEVALAQCVGDLLPASEAPAIGRLRRTLDGHLRELLLESGTSAQLWRYAQRPEAAADLEVLMAILQLAPADAPERSAAAARARDLRGESG